MEVVVLTSIEFVVSFSESQSGFEPTGEDVLTLSEAAAYLRVSEQAVLDLVSQDVLPAQKIGGEWRFLRRAVAGWLNSGRWFSREFGRFPPPWFFDQPFWDERFDALERRILEKLSIPDRPTAGPGSSQAVLRHFGVFRDDGDLDEQLADLRKRRKAAE